MPWPRFTWDATARQYRNSRGRFVPRAAVREALDAAIDRAAADIEALARRLQAGEVEIGQWQAETERLLKLLHVASGAAAVGGWGQATPETWGLVGSRLREQYRYLRDFAGQLASGLPLDGRFLARAGMYALSGTATYEAILRRGDLAAGYDLERRVLHPGRSEACPECVGYAALGWQPAGMLPDIGQASRCLTRCRCSYQRRRSGTRLPRVSPITGAIVTAFAAPEVDFDESGLVAGPEVELGDFEPTGSEPEPEPYRPPWWRRVVAFARKARLPRKAHAGLNSGCGTGAGGFKHGNTCGKRAGAHGTGRGGTQTQRKKLAAKIKALRGLAKTPEQKKQLLAAIRTLKAHERGTGDAAQAAKIRRAIHAGKAPKVAVAPKPPAAPRPTPTPKPPPAPKPKQPTSAERVQAAVAAKRAGRGLSAEKRSALAAKLRAGRAAPAAAVAHLKDIQARSHQLTPAQINAEVGRLSSLSVGQLRTVQKSFLGTHLPGNKRQTLDSLARKIHDFRESNERVKGILGGGGGTWGRQTGQSPGERIKAAVAAKRTQRGLTPEQRTKEAGLRRAVRKQRTVVESKAKRAETIRAAVAQRRAQRGLSPEQRRMMAGLRGSERARRQAAAQAKTYGGIIDPSKPISERIRSYASGAGEARRQAVLDAIQPHVDRRQELLDGMKNNSDEYNARAAADYHHDIAIGKFKVKGISKKRAAELRNEWEGKYTALRNARLRKEDELSAINGKIQAATAEALKVDDPVRIAWKSAAGLQVKDGTLADLKPEVRARADEAAAWVAKITRKGDGRRDVEHLDNLQIGEHPRDRAFFKDGATDALIAGGISTKTKSFVHELGHAIDHRLSIGDTRLAKRVKEFQEHRVAGEAPTDMARFGMAGEFGRKDKFDSVFDESSAYYAGKDYSDGATEIVAMGVQKLYEDPHGFATKDPEYFHFVTGILGGELR